KASLVKPRLPKGMRDVEALELRALQQMLRTISEVYELYGFELLDTPAFEYTDALGKFLPDTERPNEGVFSFQDDDEQWLSLRYDLTAPLARYVAANFDALPKPFRRYQYGYVFRNEKPGPGRYRQFMQFDADTVGTANPAADAEMCMLAADTLEALGIPRGSYLIKVSSRWLLDRILDEAGILFPAQRLAVLRAVDKFDRLGLQGVEQLLGKGRKDESGDFTPGAELSQAQARTVLSLLSGGGPQADDVIGAILNIAGGAGFGPDRIVFDPTVVRGLEYYTGPVFEAELTFRTADESGQSIRFGSVGGGGRYDGLVSRFRPQAVPATGFSIGVSRLYAALSHLGQLKRSEKTRAPVVVLVMDKERTGDYQKMTRALREAGIRAEMYLGDAGMKAQMRYADKRGSPCVIIQGEDERARGEITIKDLVEGTRLSGEIADHAEWREGRPAQFSVPASEMVQAVRRLLDSQQKP
ncbi:MAG TPA: histidine--tRNA ligase, partial [Hyphomicrobiales bacterium]|nr:histidine--tRNA ligase [Hyphomicrobiales bacterium]